MSMRKIDTITTMGLAFALVLALLATALPLALADGEGNSPAQLAAHGWTCANVEGQVHCWRAGTTFMEPSVAIKYFDTTDPASTNAPYLGTEILVHDHLYAGQPCPSEGLDQYTDLSLTLGLPYFACHHPKGGS
jgi:hypothetical protein